MPKFFDPRAPAKRLRKLTSLRPQLAIVLGSGSQGALTAMRVEVEISYRPLAGFPPASVAGHAGKILLGRLNGVPLIVLAGRAHFYEGHSMGAVTFPIRVLAEFGVRAVLLTNAAGGINPRLRAGDFMAVTDHINFMGVNPLVGEPPPGRERFVDLTRTYDAQLLKLLAVAARQTGTRLRRGIYLAVSGPSYETPAEIRAFARLGADAVGMSTVPEAIVARQCGLTVAALSCITNLAAGRSIHPLAHAEVLAVAEQIQPRAARLIECFATLFAAHPAIG
ncbi:MAG: purine-nucleoside phosphorylase [Verrucomicrobia bacterium]|nr:purine-nucleoside phosphorylase [Verrucomicrobiota bacterium]